MSVVSEGRSRPKRLQRKIIQAVQRGNVQQLKELLLGYQGDIDFTDTESRTLLMHAVVLENQVARSVIVDFLLNADVDVNATDADGKTALMYAVSDPDNDGIIHQLLQTPNSDPNRQDLEGNNALIHAVNSNNIRAIRVMVEINNSKTAIFDVNLTNKHGYSALLMAVKLHRVECCKVLVKEAGANPEDLSKHWQRALARFLEGDAFEVTGKRFSTRRKSVSPLSSSRKPSTKLMADASVKQNSKCPDASSFVAIGSVAQGNFNLKPPLSQIPARSSSRKASSTSSRDKSSVDSSSWLGDDLSCLSLGTSASEKYRLGTSREDSTSSLLSDSTIRDSNGRPFTVREESDSSICTTDTLTSRPNTRQDSDISIMSMETRRSRAFHQEGSNLSRRGSQIMLGELKRVHRSYERPGTSQSTIIHSTLPWSSRKISGDWLQSNPYNNFGKTSRTTSSLSSYQHGTQHHQNHFLKGTGRTAKETALKHIRGNLRIPSTPTPLTRLFNREDKSGRHLPAINSSRD